MQVTFYAGMANFIGGSDGLSFLPLFHRGVLLFFFPSLFPVIFSANKEFGFPAPKVLVLCWVAY